MKSAALVAALWLVAPAASLFGHRESGPYNVTDPFRYPEGAEQWDRVSEMLKGHPLLQRDWEQMSKLPLPPRISLHRPKMADGVGLDTILINPHPYDQKKGACLVRSPYGPTTENLADVFVATNGFAAVLQDDRGTFLSGGKFDIWKTAASDGNSTMNWITQQPWSNGEVFTAGISADGINEAMEIKSGSASLKGQMWMWTTPNGHGFSYDGGAYRQDILDGYMTFMNLMTHGEGKNIIQQARSNEAYGDWWSPLTICPFDGDDSHPSAPGCVWNNVKWPVMLVTGWWDIFHHSSIGAWGALTQASDPSVRDQHVHIINPLGHCTIDLADLHPTFLLAEADGVAVALKVAQEMFRHDPSGPTRSRIGRLNMYIMGGFNGPLTGNWNYWTSLDDFPAFTSKSLYLNADSQLVSEPVEEIFTGYLGYTYDPTDPAPMLGGNNLPIPVYSKVKGCGTEDQTSREDRSDVLVFESQPLTENMPVVGNIRAKLFVTSSARDTDFVVTVSDFHGKKSSLVRFGVQRMRWRDGDLAQAASLNPDQVYEIDVDLQYTAYVFPKGHRVRVSVSSAAYPYYSANSNSGEQDLVGEVTNVVSQNAVHFSPDYTSQIILPVVAYDDIPKNRHFSSEPPEVTV